jgi:acetyl esterase
MSVHPQVAALLQKAASSTFPTLDAVPAFVARRLYRERCALVAPQAPEVSRTGLLMAEGPVVLRWYRPAGSGKDEVLPALVFFHGGGWTIGDLDTHDVLCRQLANGARCAVFSVEYRKGPESPFPAAVEDCVAATNYVHEKAGALLVDRSRIAVGGDSAGGNLAAVVALHCRDARGPGLAYQLLIYPATDQRADYPSRERNGEGYLLTRKLMDRFRADYLPDPKQWTDWRASPLLAASLAGLPPAFVLTAGFDPLLDEGRLYAERLKREGVEATYREYPDMIHGFIVMGGVLDRANEAVNDCCAALRGAFQRVAA